jgi:hypothetical protein
LPRPRGRGIDTRENAGRVVKKKLREKSTGRGCVGQRCGVRPGPLGGLIGCMVTLPAMSCVRMPSRKASPCLFHSISLHFLPAEPGRRLP